MSAASRDNKKKLAVLLYRKQRGKCFFCTKPMVPPYLHPQKRGSKPPMDTSVLYRLTDSFSRLRGQPSRKVAACIACVRSVSKAAEDMRPIDELRARAGAFPVRGPGHDLEDLQS